MPIESADDLASFFDPEEFGEAIAFNGVSGHVAIWDRPTEDGSFGQGRVLMETNQFTLLASQVSEPLVGDLITVRRTSERFSVIAEAKRSRDGAFWHVSAAAAAP